jgi:uncharacterized tellurite resistance protein B-like protein
MSENARHQLTQTVRAHMSGADEETVRIVTAIAGVLACVAFADRHYCESEQAQLRAELERVHGLSHEAVTAIGAMLREHMVELTSTAAQIYLRDLKDLTDYETRLEVLDALMALAAADDAVSTAETNFMRRAANGLGLSSQDFHAAQARYRDKLSVLKE